MQNDWLPVKMVEQVHTGFTSSHDDIEITSKLQNDPVETHLKASCIDLL